MAAKKDNRIKTATFFVTMMDFTEAGELGVFIDEEQLQALEEKMNKRGFLEGSEMATTFNMLRANDLIWSFVVNNYLLGNDPFPFDLLYWNSDSTRMPAKMHSFYLRNMYQQNLLAEPGGITLDGVPIDLGQDQGAGILPVDAGGSYRAVEVDLSRHPVAGREEAVRAGSVRPYRRRGEPAGRRQIRSLDQQGPAARSGTWFEGATEIAGSWWPDWHRWTLSFGKAEVPARQSGRRQTDSRSRTRPAAT